MPHNYPRALTSLFFIITILSGCSSLNRMPKMIEPDWKLSAKIAVKPVNEKSQTAIIQWQKKADTSSIRCFNSFSQPLFNLFSTPTYARMDIADGTIKEAASTEQLMQTTLGWSIPHQMIELWIKGKLSGKESAVKLDQEKQLTSFDFNQWHVSFSRYQSFADQKIPTKITLTSADLRIIIIIKDYEQA